MKKVLFLLSLLLLLNICFGKQIIIQNTQNVFQDARYVIRGQTFLAPYDFTITSITFYGGCSYSNLVMNFLDFSGIYGAGNFIASGSSLIGGVDKERTINITGTFLTGGNEYQFYFEPNYGCAIGTFYSVANPVYPNGKGHQDGIPSDFLDLYFIINGTTESIPYTGGNDNLFLLSFNF